MTFSSVVLIWNWASTIFFCFFVLQWLLYTTIKRALCFIGFSGIRTRGNAIQTAIITYEHPVTKRRVVCVGMVHIGKKSYFTYLQHRIDALAKKGYAVLYEGVGMVSKKEKRQLTREQCLAADDIVTFRKTMRSCASGLRLTFQMDRITYRQSWIRTDVDRIEFLRSLEKCNLKLSELQGSPGARAPKHYRQWMTIQMHRAFAAFPFTVCMMNFIPWQGKIKKIIDLILHDRNLIAVRAIRKYGVDRNIVTLWGAGHLQGIGLHLRNGSFREAEREWITVFHFRHYGWWKFLRATVRMYWDLLNREYPVKVKR